uniref:Uncharacterized protein n=1 Tax=Yoonia rhodophyticola TaxID=3137370 RepID=A0AAN0NL66_9RHOB
MIFDAALHFGRVSLKPNGGHCGQQTTQPVKVVFGRCMADPYPPRDGAKRYRFESFFLKLGQTGLNQGYFEVAMMIFFLFSFSTLTPPYFQCKFFFWTLQGIALNNLPMEIYSGDIK